jgi:REP element-mobilizing transposase RayT/DNA-binding NarL/FixJ family response regulator
MGLPILIATPVQNFGEHIQQTLEEERIFTPVLAQDREQVLSYALKTHFVLAIIDCDLPNLSIPRLWRELQESTPGMRLIVLPPGNDPADPSLEGLKPDGFLSKPFYAPDLLATVREVLGLTGAGDESWQDPAPDGNVLVSSNGKRPVKPVQDVSPPPEDLLPPWLLDSDQITRRLKYFSTEADALAALVTHNAGLWAYAGQLSQPVAQTLAHTVIADWVQHGQPGGREGGMSDLLRFASLESSASDYLLFTTRLSGDMLLAVVFDPLTPLSRIRAQASRLVHTLASPPDPEKENLGLTRTVAYEMPPWLVGLDEEELGSYKVDEWGPEFPAEPLFSLDQVPPPTPEKTIVQQGQADDSQLGSSVPQASGGANEELRLETQQPGEPFDFELASPNSGSALQVLNSPYGIFDITYSFILIPRLPNHYLTGGLSVTLGEWMRQLSLAYGWRLEHLAIRPEYLFWISRVPPNTSAASLVNAIRQQTSQHIFLEFPLLAQENPSGDFWAPTYLALASAQPPPVNMLKEFIEQTRRQQGVLEEESTPPGDR